MFSIQNTFYENKGEKGFWNTENGWNFSLFQNGMCLLLNWRERTGLTPEEHFTEIQENLAVLLPLLLASYAFFLKKKKIFFVFQFLCFPRPASLFRQLGGKHTMCAHHPQHFQTEQSLKYLFKDKTPHWCKHRNCTWRQVQWDARLQSLLYTDFLCDHGQKLGFSLQGHSTVALQHNQGCPHCPPVILNGGYDLGWTKCLSRQRNSRMDQKSGP